jgi:hypothetical protein
MSPPARNFCSAKNADKSDFRRCISFGTNARHVSGALLASEAVRHDRILVFVWPDFLKLLF